jgi:hypothetical protein
MNVQFAFIGAKSGSRIASRRTFWMRAYVMRVGMCIVSVFMHIAFDEFVANVLPVPAGQFVKPHAENRHDPVERGQSAGQNVKSRAHQ